MFLDDLASVFQLTVREDSLGTLTVAYKDKTILLSDQPLASIAGRLYHCPRRPTRSGAAGSFPLSSSIARSASWPTRASISANPPGSSSSATCASAASRYASIGGDPTRIVIETTPRSPSAVSQEATALAVKFDADALDAVVPPLQPQALVRGHTARRAGDGGASISGLGSWRSGRLQSRSTTPCG